MNKQQKYTAVVLAAGQGTRMKSDLPKVLHPVCGETMVARVLRACFDAELETVVTVVGYGRERVEDSLRSDFATVPTLLFAVQDVQRGTADAVRCGLSALEDFAGWVFILYGDVPNIRASSLEALKSIAIQDGVAFISMRVDVPTGYGRVLRENGVPVSIVEHQECTDEQLAIHEVNAGLYLIHSDFLRLHLDQVDSGNSADEFYLTDLIAIAAKRGGVHAWTVSDPAEVMGVNTLEQLAAAERWALLHH